MGGEPKTGFCADARWKHVECVVERVSAGLKSMPWCFKVDRELVYVVPLVMQLEDSQRVNTKLPSCRSRASVPFPSVMSNTGPTFCVGPCLPETVCTRLVHSDCA